MDIIETYTGGYHKILKINIPAGETMEEHYSTSDAFIIVFEGKAKLIFKNEEIELVSESVFLIPAIKPHSLKVIEDLRAYLVLDCTGSIRNMPKASKKI